MRSPRYPCYMDEAVEAVEIKSEAVRPLHAARCCSVTPPVLHWDERLEAIVCSNCGRVYAPIVLDANQSDRDSVIRALVMCKGIREQTGVALGIDRHAVRRRLKKHQLDYKDDELVVTYAGRGPTVDDLIGE